MQLHEAHNALLETRTLICWKDSQHFEIDRLIEGIDNLYSQVNPNEKAKK